MFQLSQVILKRLAALAVHVPLCAGAPLDELAAFPENILQQVLSDDELDADAHGRIVRLLARDPRPAVRRAAVHRLSSHDGPRSDEAELLLEQLAADPDAEVRVTFLEHVAEIFDRSSILERTRLVAQWATSESPHVRRAVARALQSPFVVLGGAWALRALHEDSDPAVRREAHLAAVLRRIDLEAA